MYAVYCATDSTWYTGSAWVHDPDEADQMTAEEADHVSVQPFETFRVPVSNVIEPRFMLFNKAKAMWKCEGDDIFSAYAERAKVYEKHEADEEFKRPGGLVYHVVRLPSIRVDGHRRRIEKAVERLNQNLATRGIKSHQEFACNLIEHLADTWRYVQR